jgi:hypothetical protein
LDTSQTFLNALINALKRASAYNTNDLVAPAAVLWTDKDCQWESIIPLVQNHLSLLVLGDYAPEKRTGPAYYLRCMIARTLPEDKIPDDKIPIIYLPGVSKQEIRAIEECPEALQPLVDLQYRGTLWVQTNGRDWTVPAFIQSQAGGLRIEIGSDQSTKDAAQRALIKLLDEPVKTIKNNAPLKASYFDSLLTTDEHRNILDWLQAPEDFQHKISNEEWKAFSSICKNKYGFDPHKDGVITAAQLMSEGNGDWHVVWARFKEAPRNFPGMENLLRRAGPQQASFEHSEFWPQDNETAERQLQSELVSLENQDAESARNRLIELEKLHGNRRDWVWGTMGKSPYANALVNLANLAGLTQKALSGDDLATIINAYVDWGWQADAQVIKALQKTPRQEEADIVKQVIRLIYEPWLRTSAEQFQKVIQSNIYQHTYLPIPENGTCILFTDALRMDTGQMLVEELRTEGLQSEIEPYLAALPTITSTAKPAFFDLGNSLIGEGTQKLTPRINNKKSLLNAQAYRDLLGINGFQILFDNDLGDPSGIGWTELGAIDVYGHAHGWKIASHIESEINIITERILSLLNFGWEKVVVITDHGWLMLPGGLGKNTIPEHITEIRKGRCAELKSGARSEHFEQPWFWNSDIAVAMAPGISCFESGKEYEHGGISPQECITPRITVSKEKNRNVLKIHDAKWRGLRFSAFLENSRSDVLVDIRVQPGDKKTSVVFEAKYPDEAGDISLLIKDEDKIGDTVYVVVLSTNGQILVQRTTVIGE